MPGVTLGSSARTWCSFLPLFSHSSHFWHAAPVSVFGFPVFVVSASNLVWLGLLNPVLISMFDAWKSVSIDFLVCPLQIITIPFSILCCLISIVHMFSLRCYSYDCLSLYSMTILEVSAGLFWVTCHEYKWMVIKFARAKKVLGLRLPFLFTCTWRKPIKLWPLFSLAIWWVLASYAFVSSTLIFVCSLLTSQLPLIPLYFIIFCSLSQFSHFPSLSLSLSLFLYSCCMSDSFCGPNPYTNTPLFHSEPPAIAGLFRGMSEFRPTPQFSSAYSFSV